MAVKGVNFKGAEIIMGAPPGEEGSIYGLPVRRVEKMYGDHGAWLSVWRPTDEERAALAAGGVVEVALISDVHPPVSLSVQPGALVVEND